MTTSTAAERSTNIKNAHIRSARIHRERGIPTYTIQLEGNGWGQGFGHYDLRWWGVYPLFRLMDVVGVSEWSGLEGEAVRVDASITKVHGIGHITEDRWFYPEREKSEVRSDD